MNKIEINTTDWIKDRLVKSVEFNRDLINKDFTDNDIEKWCNEMHGIDNDIFQSFIKKRYSKVSVTNFINYMLVSWETRIEYMLLYSKTKRNTLEYFQNALGDIEGLNRFNSRKCTTENMTKKYGNKRALEINKSKSITLPNMIKKYGIIEGQIKYDSYIENLTNAWNKETMISKHGEDWYNKMIKGRFNDLESYIRRDGIEIGTKKYKEFCDKTGYGNTLEYYIEKFGKEVGTNKYIKITKTKVESLKYVRTIEYYKEKYPTNWQEKWDNRYIMGSYSKVSQELFNLIEGNIIINDNSYYATKNNEFGKYNTINKKSYLYDYVITGSTNIVIEFNGDIFHANPKLFNESDRPNPFNKKLTSVDIWKHDKTKNDFIINQGFKLLIVWEADYKKDKTKELNRCLDFIMENTKK